MPKILTHIEWVNQHLGRHADITDLADALFIATSMTSYAKYVAKEYICEYTKDFSYMNKPKVESLFRAFRQKDIYTYIDEDMNFIKDYPTEEYYNYGNDFERMIVK